ncbi:ATP-binding protein [Lyngbya aestuarii]|uniref:ATP-binding protein n=1 Tax=Lyngbya aestuarii TaxID=118322 RepID=UPI00403E1CB0
MANYFDLDKIIAVREINAAVINISGRQRMLSQRAALFALRLVLNQDYSTCQKWQQEMLVAVDLMEKSHQGLLQGDIAMKLPGHPSKAVKKMYFEAPVFLDQQIRDYISQVRALAKVNFTELTIENPHLEYILRVSATSLVEGLEAVVSQYQKESDAYEFNIEVQQIQLYKKSCQAKAMAEAKTQELEEALQNLQRTQAQLIQAEKLSSIGEMVAGVAHELNNPISFIYCNLHHASDYVQYLVELHKLYQEYYSDLHPVIQAKIEAVDLDFWLEDLPKVIASMQVGADRLSEIVLSLRNFSRRDQSLSQVVDLHAVIDSTLLILQHRLKAHGDCRGLEIVKDYSTLPPVECYPGQMCQVFLNLVSNAIDTLEDIPNHLGCITIRTSISTDNSVVIIQISDNGLGMTPEVKESIFEPFFTTKPSGKGTGLGLSISHQIVVEKHSGVLQCESTPGKGTTFQIEIPVQINQDFCECESQLIKNC